MIKTFFALALVVAGFLGLWIALGTPTKEGLRNDEKDE